MTKDALVRALESRRDEIIERWTEEVIASSPKYAARPREEIVASVNEMIAGVGAAASEGDYSRLFDFMNRIVAVRSSMGFRLTEVQRVVNIGTGILMEAIRSECRVDAKDECFEAMKRLMDVMYWASMNLGDTFEEIRSKEFTAGTLVALGAAQQDMDERGVMRKSLELVMGLMGCTHGAISMHHLGGCAVTIPSGNRQSSDLFIRISGRVMRGKKPVTMHKEEIDRLVPPDADAGGAGVFCATGIPIRARGRIMGALILGSTTDRDLSSHELRFLEAVASQIGLACDNARMLQQIKSREEFIRREHDEILTIMNELGALVYVSDMKTYELLAANKPALETFGRDIIGRQCYEVLQTDQEGPCPFCTNPHLLKDGKPTEPYVWTFQNTLTGKWFKCLDRAIEWPDGRMARLEIALDVTDLEMTKQRLEEIRSALQLYNDLLVHDVANYAGTAKGFVQMLSEEDLPPEKREEMARTAVAQLDRIGMLADRVAKLTKTEAQGRESMSVRDLAAVLDEAVSVVAAAREGASVEFCKEYPEGCMVEVGEFVTDIFTNLLANAVRYGQGRPVKVTVSEDRIGDRPAWRASVTDEGPGVPPDKKEGLFGRYVRLTTLSQLKGQGLGLTIVKGLTEAYGGKVGMDDRVPGDHTKGSVFHVAFPKAGPKGP